MDNSKKAKAKTFRISKGKYQHIETGWIIQKVDQNWWKVCYQDSDVKVFNERIYSKSQAIDKIDNHITEKLTLDKKKEDPKPNNQPEIVFNTESPGRNPKTYNLYAVVRGKTDPKKLGEVSQDVVDFANYYLKSSFTESGNKIYEANNLLIAFAPKKNS